MSGFDDLDARLRPNRRGVIRKFSERIAALERLRPWLVAVGVAGAFVAALSRVFEGTPGIVLAITGAVVAALGGGLVAAIDYRKLELGANLTEAEAIAEEAITRGQALEQERDRARIDADALDRKRLALIDANRTMREALEQVLLVPEATLDQAASAMLQAALRFLVASVGFEADEEWAISVFQVQGERDGAVLRRIAAVRADRLTERLDARSWGRNEGVVGAAWVGERDVIIENGDDPRVQEDYPVPADRRRDYDDRRYRSMAAVPVRLGPGPAIWGVVAASTDRAGRFRRDPGNRQVQTVDTVRGIARMMALMAAAYSRSRA